MHTKEGYDLDRIEDVGSELWRSLSKALNEKSPKIIYMTYYSDMSSNRKKLRELQNRNQPMSVKNGGEAIAFIGIDSFSITIILAALLS